MIGRSVKNYNLFLSSLGEICRSELTDKVRTISVIGGTEPEKRTD